MASMLGNLNYPCAKPFDSEYIFLFYIILIFFMRRKEFQVPPRSSSTLNLNVSSANTQAALLVVPEVSESVMPDISGIDFNALFHCNSE